jgi:hypothetical protein
LVIAWAGCSSRTEIVLQYQLQAIDLSQLVRVETLISVDPSDGRQFFVDTPYRSVDTGVGVEVRDFNGTGERQMLLTQDVTLGYRFAEHFSFTLLPPASEKAPPLVFRARAVAAGGQIGATMPLTARFGPAASLAVLITDQRCAGVSCTSEQDCCADQCVSVAADPANCGGCGAACGQTGDSCASSVCRCAGGSACTSQASCCSGRGCVQLNNDAFNCGSCGHACNPGESCAGGMCSCNGGSGCAAGLLCCSDGSCAATCPCGATACNAPSQCCDPQNGVCADLGSDSQNCGACGHACTAPLTCVGGACACNGVVCATGDMCCTTGCRNLANDAQNCGGCGRACGEGFACVAGACTCNGATCSPGQICCDSTCVDPETSSSHCGSCAVSCSRGEACSGGACGCGSTQCQNNETCCTDGCFDLQNSSVHCGSSCSAPGCPAGFACMGGMCQQTTCIPACTSGNTCVGTTCMCGTSPQCPTAQTCCPDGCFDLSSDNNHCHSCTHACPAQSQCVSGACKKNLGVSCTSAAECASNHCSDGVCCNVDCTGACMYCAQGFQPGSCLPVVSGSDPHGLCVSHPSSACGTTGQCSNGACAYWSAGTSCAGASPDKCADATNLMAWQCDGMDSCVANKINCEPYKCLPNAGGTSNAVCGTGPCAVAMDGGCTILLNNCAPDATCCMPKLVNNCQLTHCGQVCPL